MHYLEGDSYRGVKRLHKRGSITDMLGIGGG